MDYLLPGCFPDVTKSSKFTRFECSPNNVCTVDFGFVPVWLELFFGAEGPIPPTPELMPPISKGLGDVVPTFKPDRFKYMYI